MTVPSTSLLLAERLGSASEPVARQDSTRRRMLAGVGVAASTLVLGVAANGRRAASASARVAVEVRAEFLHSWRGYQAAA
jgi:mannosyl-oligosaccharide alpha-1,2-mannosidase